MNSFREHRVSAVKISNVRKNVMPFYHPRSRLGTKQTEFSGQARSSNIHRTAG
jgi:hypothetical protein